MNNYERKFTRFARNYPGIITMTGMLALIPVLGKATELGFSEEDAVRVVEDAGYIEPEITDKDIFLPGLRGCAREDALSYEVSAISATTNREVELLVCDGLFKQATIRTQ